VSGPHVAKRTCLPPSSRRKTQRTNWGDIVIVAASMLSATTDTYGRDDKSCVPDDSGDDWPEEIAVAGVRSEEL
jgi:hypothetical protein